MLAPLTYPVSWIYGLAVATRNSGFDRGRRVAAVDVPVISVGNITAGGAGKTPMVGWIAAWLLTQGRRPLIAMRGYGARAGEPSDEQQEHRQRLPDVHVLANPDRVVALKAFLPGHTEVDCVVLDDGFQHRRLARDLDLVLVDATRGSMRDHLLPRGWLREPLVNLGRADAVIVTRADGADDGLAGEIERYHGKPPVAWSRHVWTHLQVLATDERPEFEDVAWLAGKRLVTMLGVGHPTPILGQLERAGATVAGNVPARDHERYDRARITVARGLCEGVDALVMTGKDWVKARHLIDLASWPVPIVVPWLEIDVFDGEDALKQLILNAVTAQAPECRA
jgi:tetraacyldisaccharide 4'-kinase